MSQKRVEKPAERDTTESAEEKLKDLTPAADKAKRSANETVDEIDAALKENEESKQSDADSLVNEIDEILQTDAEAFVRDFVQRGGQ